MRDRTVTFNGRRCRPFKGRDRGSGGPVDPRAGATSGQIWSPADGHDGARGARSVGAGGSTNQALTDFGSAEKLCLQPPAHGKRIFANKRQVQIFFFENSGANFWQTKVGSSEEPDKSELDQDPEDSRFFVCSYQ